MDDLKVFAGVALVGFLALIVWLVLEAGNFHGERVKLANEVRKVRFEGGKQLCRVSLKLARTITCGETHRMSWDTRIDAIYVPERGTWKCEFPTQFIGELLVVTTEVLNDINKDIVQSGTYQQRRERVWDLIGSSPIYKGLCRNLRLSQALGNLENEVEKCDRWDKLPMLRKKLEKLQGAVSAAVAEVK